MQTDFRRRRRRRRGACSCRTGRPGSGPLLSSVCTCCSPCPALDPRPGLLSQLRPVTRFRRSCRKKEPLLLLFPVTLVATACSSDFGVENPFLCSFPSASYKSNYCAEKKMMTRRKIPSHSSSLDKFIRAKEVMCFPSSSLSVSFTASSVFLVSRPAGGGGEKGVQRLLSVSIHLHSMTCAK